MTPDALASLHAAAFAPSRGWSAEEFARLCNSAHVTCYCGPESFALVRSLAGEAELLTLAVHPKARRKGHARALMTKWLAAENAQTAFLEVAEDNIAALDLYRAFGFTEQGRRRAYYKREHGIWEDALLMQLALPAPDTSETATRTPKTG